MTTGNKIRVYQLAKELDVSSTDLIEFCKQMGIEVKSHSSSLDLEIANLLKEEHKRRLRGQLKDKQVVTGKPSVKPGKDGATAKDDSHETIDKAEIKKDKEHET